jgi:hypothetical protein
VSESITLAALSGLLQGAAGPCKARFEFTGRERICAFLGNTFGENGFSNFFLKLLRNPSIEDGHIAAKSVILSVSPLD